MKEPPNWSKDQLSGFIQAAQDNTFATFFNRKFEYEKLRDIDVAFRKALDYLDNSPEWFAGIFLLRAHSCYLGAARLSISTQVYESYMVLRGCLESALYGFFISKNPGAKKIWLDRHESEQSLKLMKKFFQISAIFTLLEKVDKKKCAAIQELYNRTIDYGGHPNPHGLLGTLSIREREEHIDFQVGYLVEDSIQLQLALKTTAQVGVGALVLFQFIFPERFKITGLDEEIRILAKDL